MIVYIAGKMAGLPDKGRRAFARAEDRLRRAGYVVLNPAILPENMPAEKYMPMCLAMLNAADAIYMLDNWKDSAGATIERRYAEYQGKLVIEEGKS